MRLAHFIEIQVFAKPEESVEEIKQGIINLMPFNLEEEKIKLQEQNASTFHEREIKIYTFSLKKEKHTNKFLHWLAKNLSEHTKQTIKTQLDSRIDEELHFFLRFDKDKWVEEKKLFLVDHGNCYHLKISVASYPRSKEKVKEILREMFT